MKKNISITNFTISDLESINHILEKDFDEFWNSNILKSDLENSSCIYLCCKDNSEIIGFGGIKIILDTAELNNIVIKKSKRGLGYSSLLLKDLIQKALENQCKKINLEVSRNNIVAIKLYEKFGFKQVGLRPKYYSGVDALLYTLSIN